MENYRYLLSLPSELAQIKKELLQQQQDLNQILENNSYENNLKKLENTFNETTIDGDYTVIPKEPLSLPEGKENLDSQGRIVIDVVSPPKFNLQKSASKRDDSSKKVAKIQDTIEKSKKSTKIKTSRDCPTKVRSPDGAEESGPLVYEFQKQENGELKVVTTRDPSIMPQSDQIRDLQRPPTRSHQTNVTSRKDKKEKREKPKPSKSSQTCPVCSTYLPHLSPDDFHSHVDSHFDEDESDFFELMNRAD